MSGKWFLEHTYSDEMESMGNEVQMAEVALVATDEVMAMAEAKAIWQNILQEATARWERQKATWAHPPSGPFDGLNPNPRVVYRIPL